MADNILTDAEKLKKVVDMASQQNSKSYEAKNPEELKKAVEEAPKGSTIVYNEMPQLDNNTLMSKEHLDAINEANTKSLKKQIKKKKEEGIESLSKDIKELKEIMRLQMEVDKMRNGQKVPIQVQITKKPENMDDDGFIDMTKQASPMNVYQKDDMIMMSPKVQTPYDAGVRNPLPVSREKSLSPEIKLAVNEKTVPNPIVDVDKKKKVKMMNQQLKTTLFWIGGFICVLIFVAGFRVLMNLNYFMSVLISIVINFGIFTTIYFTKIKVPEHQMPRKETVNYNNFELAEIRRCPNCNSKLQKSKVIQSADGFTQHIKCPNIECDFRKTIDVKKEHGY